MTNQNTKIARRNVPTLYKMCKRADATSHQTYNAFEDINVDVAKQSPFIGLGFIGPGNIIMGVLDAVDGPFATDQAIEQYAGMIFSEEPYSSNFAAEIKSCLAQHSKSIHSTLLKYGWYKAREARKKASQEKSAAFKALLATPAKSIGDVLLKLEASTYPGETLTEIINDCAEGRLNEALHSAVADLRRLAAEGERS